MRLGSTPWIPLEKIDSVVQVEPFLLIVGLAVTAWGAYRLLLREVSPERHQLLQGLLKNLFSHLIALTVLFVLYEGTIAIAEPFPEIPWERLRSYLGFVTLITGSTVIVKTAKILLFEYLFLWHMKVGVPVLLVNLSTLMLSLLIGGWLLSELFSIRLAPLLATSAIFSVILGLALQDTLGNLFAGVALQFDKPAEIGDWVEIQNGMQKWVGQIEEVTWRATVLIGLSDERITLPNRIVAQSQVSNFSLHSKPIIRSQQIRIPYGADVSRLQDTLIAAVRSTPGVRAEPAPLLYLSETQESFILARVIYFLDDYGTQWNVGDKVLRNMLSALEQNNLPLAGPRLSVAIQPSAERPG